MKSIKENSTLLRFICDHDKAHNVGESDYLQLSLNDFRADVIELSYYSTGVWIKRAKIGGIKLNSNCASYVYQDSATTLHGRMKLFECDFKPSTTSECSNHSGIVSLFGNYKGTHCLEKTHVCLIKSESTT
ncbi:Hypothetical predicted protein [Paramuricea clavata]|uniref:Uncharacterized protein n=1 Tax=Paramuricea clavata TaxID=317549 RepID=A0A6S7G4R7_PARCT|nr:Hypothetical predicted protein [Paramuricea clavata]